VTTQLQLINLLISKLISQSSTELLRAPLTEPITDTNTEIDKEGCGNIFKNFLAYIFHVEKNKVKIIFIKIHALTF
jgi:hypothetical protein